MRKTNCRAILKQRTWHLTLLGAVLASSTALTVVTPTVAANIDNLWREDRLANQGVAVSNDGSAYVSGSYYFSPQGVIEITSQDRPASISAISGDWHAVAGMALFENSLSRAFRWTAEEGVRDLGSLIESDTYDMSGATGISRDGTRVVGWSYRDEQHNRSAFVWVEGATNGVAHNAEMFQLVAEDTETTNAHAVSDDGNFVVGSHYSPIGGGYQHRAMRWDVTDIETTGAQFGETLGTLGGNASWANAVSADGRKVVGVASNENSQQRAFLWTEGATNGVEGNEQMRDLGTLGGAQSFAHGISSNGTFVVGRTSTVDSYNVAFRWSEETGMESVSNLLTEQGVSIGDWILKVANDVSDDGKVIIGTMEVDDDERAFLARLYPDQPGPGTGSGGGGGVGLMDIAEYNATLYSAAGIAHTGEALSWLPLNGAHHRPLMLTPNLAGDMCAWATGDFAHHGASSTGMALAEVGACTDLVGGSVRIGGSLGTTASWQDLALGGSTDMRGQYVLSEVDWQPDGTPLLLSVTGMFGGYSVDIDRAYSNGAATAISSGETNAYGAAIKARVDWLEAATIGNTTINPYASIGFGRTHVDGYTETGGPFPAVFNAQTVSHADIRLGVTAITHFSTQTSLSTTLEIAHRTGDAATASGTVPGAFDFSIGGGRYSQTWARVGAELDHKITDAVSLSTSAHLATNGRDPSLALSAGLKASF
jgi:probable HAF family extracellular repeat protein